VDTAAPGTAASTPAAEPDAGAEQDRYRFETPIGRTDVSHLSRALDTILDRSVIIERYLEGGLDEAAERRLLGLARGGSPYVQWALSCDRAAGVAVFEAPRGVPVADVFDDTRLDARTAVRLLACLARAVAPMHERGAAHGAIAATTVMLDEQQNPTLLVCGLGRAPAEPSLPRDDVRDILRLVARCTGVDIQTPDAGALAAAVVDALAPGLPAPARATVLASEPYTGEELYAFAERFEVAVLRAEQAAARAVELPP
jgi:hypothetical protein